MRGDNTNSSRPWMENVATIEFCQFVLPVTEGKAMLLFLSFLLSLARSSQPRSLLPCPKTLCQPSREQLSHCSTASSISAISFALSLSSQQASNNSQLPFCLSLPSARPIGRFSQLPSPRSHAENISASLRRMGGGVLGRTEGSWEDRQREET